MDRQKECGKMKSNQTAQVENTGMGETDGNSIYMGYCVSYYPQVQQVCPWCGKCLHPCHGHEPILPSPPPMYPYYPYYPTQPLPSSWTVTSSVVGGSK